MSRITLTVNRQAHTVDVDPQTPLLYVLSDDLALRGPKFGCGLGQGIFTVQTQLVAEELSVPISRVRLIQCDTAVTPDQGTTSGSQSTPTNFNERNLALAAATAREALLKLGAERLGIPVDQLVAADGEVAVKADRAKRVM